MDKGRAYQAREIASRKAVGDVFEREAKPLPVKTGLSTAQSAFVRQPPPRQQIRSCCEQPFHQPHTTAGPAYSRFHIYGFKAGMEPATAVIKQIVVRILDLRHRSIRL
jgi:hypothetical protein